MDQGKGKEIEGVKGKSCSGNRNFQTHACNFQLWLLQNHELRIVIRILPEKRKGNQFSKSRRTSFKAAQS